MDKKIVLFITQTLGYKKACGIGIMGDLVGNTLLKSTAYDFKLIYADNHDPIEAAIIQHNPVAVIYNYAEGSTPWMDDRVMRNKYNNIPHFKLYHDMHQQRIDTFNPDLYGGYQYIIADDPTLKSTDRVFTTQRLIPPYSGPYYPDPEIPTIGFQGFGPWHKGIARLATMVNNEFDTAILRLHIPFGFYGDPHGNDARKRVEECKQVITKPGIKIVATHNFLSTEETINILAQNTINCYLYDFNAGGGLASSPDYALAAKKPIAVTRSHQLRNYWNLTPSVCVEDRSLKAIISDGLIPLKSLHEAYTTENVIKDYENILHAVLKD
jgi:hypothetical protein